MKISNVLQRHPRGWLFVEATIVILIVGSLDFYTGYEVSLSILYGVPIYVVAWYCDRNTGILLALIAGLTWWWANVEVGHPYLQSWHDAWETFVRLSFFIFIAIGAAALRAEKDIATARITLLEHTQRLEQEIIRISEREQRRIGQDLHDGLCQYLAALGCAAAALKSDLEKKHLTREAESADELATLLKDAVVQTRDSARGLVPLHLGEAGLASALEGLALSVTRLQGIQCTFESDNPQADYDEQIATHLYRIAQEAINNATKHGRAHHISLSLQAANGITTLRITDDGAGIPQSALSNGGMGLSIMNYRARLSGGELSIDEEKGGGTVVRCRILPENAQRHESAA